MKKLIKNILFKIVFLNTKIKLDYRSDIAFKFLKTFRKRSKNNAYPVNIRESIIGNIQVGEGAKFYKCICNGKIKIGNFVTVYGPGTRISSKLNGISIGNFTSIASNVIIQEYYHRYDKISTYYMSQNIFKESSYDDIFSKGKIIIEDDVWIGSNSVILSGVTIGRGSIVGAGSVVTKDVPPYSIAVGNPAKVIKKRFSKEIEDYIESLKWWEWDIEKILDNKDMFKIDINNK